MIPREVLQKVRRIEIRTRKLVNESLAGEYHSVFKGRGMEFSEVREYAPGDDIRIIDWNVTSRFGYPFVKRFVEERELTVMLMVDMSGSAEFGTAKHLKSEIAIEICALLAFSAIRNNDRVGLLLFTDSIERFIPPKKGRQHVLRVIRELLYFKPEGKGTDIPCALEYMNSVIKKRSIAFLISDFISPDFQKVLKVVNRKHDVIAIFVSDPREEAIPDIGLARFEDAETGVFFLFDTSRREAREAFSRAAVKRKEEVRSLFRSTGVDLLEVRTDQPYDKTLIGFFRERARRFR
ncbi:MAG: DUF58 domain-containing protein [Acidobacteriota bacterium]